MKYLRRILLNKTKIWIGKILRFRPKPPVLRRRSSKPSTLKARPRKRRTRKGVATAAAIVAVVVFIAWRYFIASLPVYYIAYVGRDRPFFDEFHQHAIQKHLNELNADLSDKRIELKLFSNHQTEAGSRQAYEEILRNPRILAVIDNTWGRELQSVSDLIAQNNLPVISMNADKGDKGFNNHVVFMGYDDDVPTKVIAFSRKVLKVSHVIFVTEQNYKLSDVFIQEFKKARTTTVPLYVGDFRAASQLDKDSLLLDVDAQIAECQKDQACTPTVILNTHGSWGNEIIKHIDAGHHGVTILGASSIVDWANYDRQFGLNENKNKLIIFTYPHDSVISKVYNDLTEIKINGVELGRPNELLFVKRSLDAVSIIRGALLDDLTWKSRSGLSRDGFVDFFNNRLASNRLIGLYDLYVFDQDLRVADERSFEEYFEGKTFSYEKQLDANNNPVPTVYFDLSEIVVPVIDLKTKTFQAQFVLWVSSDQPGAEKNIHFQNARAGLKMEPIPESPPNNDSAELLRDGSPPRRNRAFKVSSEFNMIGDTANYPFDSQELTIEIAALGNNPRLSFDLSTLGKDSLGEWTCGEPYVTKDHHIVRSPISTADREKGKSEKYQTVTLRVPIQRRWQQPFVTIMVPLFLIAVSALALLYIRDGAFASQGQICIAIFLALIAYSLPFEGMVPRSGAVTVADKMFYCTFLTVLAVFLKVCFVNSTLISASLKRRLSSRSILVGNVALASYCGTVISILIQASL